MSAEELPKITEVRLFAALDGNGHEQQIRAEAVRIAAATISGLGTTLSVSAEELPKIILAAAEPLAKWIKYG